VIERGDAERARRQPDAPGLPWIVEREPELRSLVDALERAARGEPQA
jgi:hypothetical protein